MMKSFKGTSSTSLVVNSYKFSKKRSFCDKGHKSQGKRVVVLWWLASKTRRGTLRDCKMLKLRSKSIFKMNMGVVEGKGNIA